MDGKGRQVATGDHGAFAEPSALSLLNFGVGLVKVSGVNGTAAWYQGT